MSVTGQWDMTADDNTYVPSIAAVVGANPLAADAGSFFTTNNRAEHPFDAGARMVTSESNPSYYTVKCKYRLMSTVATKQYVDTYAKRADDNNFYCAKLDRVAGTISLRKRVSGADTTLASTSYSWPAGADADVWLVVKDSGGQKLEVWMDGALALGPISDTSLSTAGQAGALVDENVPSTSTTGIHWDQIIIDDAAPSAGSSVAKSVPWFFLKR